MVDLNDPVLLNAIDFITNSFFHSESEEVSKLADDELDEELDEDSFAFCVVSVVSSVTVSSTCRNIELPLKSVLTKFDFSFASMLSKSASKSSASTSSVGGGGILASGTSDSSASLLSLLLLLLLAFVSSLMSG